MEPVIGRVVRGLNRVGLRDVQLRGELPIGGFVWAANHHSWWDGFAAAGALWGSARRPALLMDAANLQRFAYLRRAGVVGTDRLREAVADLRGGAAMVVFPEGELRPPGPLGELHRGAGWLAVRSGRPIVPVATRAVMRGHQAPEYLVDVGPELHGDDPRLLTLQLRDELATRLADLDRLVTEADPVAPLPGFRVVHRGRRDWDERFGATSAVRR